VSIQGAQQFVFGFWQGRTVSIEAVEKPLSSDGGLFVFGQLDEKLDWTASFARQIGGARSGRVHSVLDIIRQRVFGIIAGYEDQNDHDTLRSDPIFKLLAQRHPTQDEDLASQPTISRLENAVTAADLLRLEDWFIDRFVASFEEEPRELTLDIDTFDDPTHGTQQLTFFHDFYEQHQYQVRAITCANNDMLVFPVLLYGTAPVALGAAADLRRVIERLRSRFGDIKIHVRADAGFASPEIYETLEQLNVTFSIGFTLNSKLQRLSAELRENTTLAHQTSGQPEIRYQLVEDYRAKNWSRSRTIVVKCEVTAHSTTRRAVITNRTGALVSPEGAYCEYADRGESENRNKELKCEFRADRLSDHRYMANLFRLMMHCLANNLLVAMRRLVADPPKAPTVNGVPPEASLPRQKRRMHNERRKQDPLGEGYACTWRTYVIKVATRVVISVRRVCLQLSASWPHLEYLTKVARAIADFSPFAPSG